MDELSAATMVDAAIATGLGVLVGLEREHHEANERQAGEAMLGVRTFALLGLLGWALGYLGQASPWLPPVGLLIVGGLIAATFARAGEHVRGLTTEVAAVVTSLLGMIVTHSRALAAALAVVTTLLLISKPWFGRFVPRLRRMDLTATLQMAILLAIVLPLLPVEAPDPWDVLSPRRIGLFITLILAVGYIGYVLNRTVGARRGAGLTGLIGGLTSSTAVTVAMAQAAKRDAGSGPAGQLATFLANAVMAARIVVITAVVSRAVAAAVAPALGTMFVVFVGGAVWKWLALRGTETAAEGTEVELKNPLAIGPALKWGAFICFVLVAAAIGRQVLGARGVLVAAALSGFADVDAITLAVSRQADADTLPVGYAALAIVIAASMNNVVKAGIALVAGGRGYGRDIALVFALALASSLTVAVALGL